MFYYFFVFSTPYYVVLSLYPQFSRKEKREVIKLALQLRKANLFNHYLVSFPLINYSDDLDENCDLTSVSPEQIRNMGLKIQKSNKISFFFSTKLWIQ